MPPGRGHNGDAVMHPSGARSISGEPPRNRQSRAKKPRHRGPMPGFPSRGEQRKEPNSILIRGLSASPVFSLRTFSTFSTESPEAQCPWNGHFLRQLGFQPQVAPRALNSGTTQGPLSIHAATATLASSSSKGRLIRCTVPTATPNRLNRSARPAASAICGANLLRF